MVLCELTQDDAGRQACIDAGALSRPRPSHKPKQKRTRGPQPIMGQDSMEGTK